VDNILFSIVYFIAWLHDMMNLTTQALGIVTAVALVAVAIKVRDKPNYHINNADIGKTVSSVTAHNHKEILK
jgi:hypothetical protein